MENTNNPIPPHIQYGLMKSHAVFMLVGWWLLIGHGILFSRYFKTVWTAEWKGAQLWFQLHRLFNLSGLFIIASGLLFMLIKNWGWVSAKNLEGINHSTCGIIAITIVVLQVCVAFFRPNRINKFRCWFNLLHRFFGAAAFFLSVATAFLALGFLSKSDWGRAPLALMICYLVAYIFTIVAMEIHLQHIRNRTMEPDTTAQEESQHLLSSHEKFEIGSYFQAGRTRLYILGVFSIIAVIIVTTLSLFVVLQ